MQRFVCFIFLVVTLASFSTLKLGAPLIVKFTPELISAVVLIYVLIAGTRRRFNLVAPKYWLTFGALALIIVCGIATNGVDSGPLLMDLRLYLRAIPLFFLPAVFDFQDTQIMQQLQLLMYLSLLQLPIAVYQRWVILSHMRFTGDDVRGTLLQSGILSVFLICASLIATGQFLRGYISRLWFVPLVLLLLIPTMINETKVTIFYVPLGLLIVFLIGVEPGRRIQLVAWAAALLVGFGALYVPIYNRMNMYAPGKEDTNIAGFLTDKKQMSRYLSKDVAGLGTKKDIRRGDAIKVPLQFLAKDPIRLALGLGVGSIAPSNMGPTFEGRYRPLFQGFLITSFTDFVIEIGILGISLVLVLHWLVFRDALYVARNDKSRIGAVALGWTGVVVLMALSLVYTVPHEFDSLSYLYWYFSGLIAARRVQLGLSNWPHAQLTLDTASASAPITAATLRTQQRAVPRSAARITTNVRRREPG